MPASTGLMTKERELLEQARAGDEHAFCALIEPHRADLHAHCYRMLGSLHDADDALQDAMLRAWRGLPRFEGRSATHSWLHRITTNACLDAIARRPKRVLPIDYGPADRPGRSAGGAAVRAPLRRALPGLGARPRSRIRGARGPVRAARGGRARVHRRAPAPAAAPTGCPDPPGGPRLLRSRDRPGA